MPKYMIQGPSGPMEAMRPPQEDLDGLIKIRERGARVTRALELASLGYIIDAPVDFDGWDYEKAMAQRRLYGVKWVPNAIMPNVQHGFATTGPAPIGAILVPPEGGWPS